MTPDRQRADQPDQPDRSDRSDRSTPPDRSDQSAPPTPHFQQMYYTSCERGLSGFSGFQFNAVSAGVTAETQRAAEALAGYEPPRSLVESDTPELLERCPVNLCYRPYDRAGRRALTLCVRYVGRDSARRFGNYFAHALHTEDFPAAGGGVLGIELWGSAAWTHTVSTSTRIPELTAPPRGPLGARAVRDFLRGHPHAEQLPHLLAAVFAALTEHGSVVVVDDTTDRNAHWFAAVCYLLPPPLARRLSFATYVFRPARSRLHLIGTVPGARLDFGPEDEAAYTVFDFSRGHFPQVAVPDLLLLLTRIGVGSVRPVWSWTADYLRGGEESEQDWHGPVATAAASGGITLTAADLRAVLDWLPGADHLGPRRAAVAADLHRRHRHLDDAQLAVLSAAAKTGGDTAAHREIEGRLYASRMRTHMHGADDATEPVPLTDPAVRERATSLWRRLLESEARTARERTRLLLWALGARLPVAPEVLDRETATLARALLGAPSLGPGFQREVTDLVNALPRMRDALVGAVAEALGRRDGQEQLFAQFPARLLDERDLAGHPVLLEHHLRARAEREPENTVAYLFRILQVRDRLVPDEDLLRALWRHRTPTWTHREATRIAQRLPSTAAVDRAVGQWFDRAVNQRIDDDAQLAACLHLCWVLAAVPDRLEWLPPVGRERVRTTLHLHTALRESREATELLRAFATSVIVPWAAPMALRQFRLVPALLRLPAHVGRLAAGLPALGDRALGQYLTAVHQVATAGQQVDDVRLGHVAAAALTSDVGLSQAHREMVAAILAHPAHHWRPADLRRLEHVVRPHHPALADRYAEFGEDRRRTPRRLARRLPRLGRRSPGSPGTPGAPGAPDTPDAPETPGTTGPRNAPDDGPPENPPKKRGR